MVELPAKTQSRLPPIKIYTSKVHDILLQNIRVSARTIMRLKQIVFPSPMSTFEGVKLEPSGKM